MARSKIVLRVRGLGFIIWHGRHYAYHLLLGIAWLWLVQRVFGEFTSRDVFVALLGSLLPDADHLWYWLTYGKSDEYVIQIKQMVKTRQWRNFTVFCESGHKHNTSLMTHNVYFMLVLSSVACLAYLFDRRTSFILLGTMVLHYIFDIVDDILTLGYINPNWKRWGRKKSTGSSGNLRKAR